MAIASAMGCGIPKCCKMRIQFDLLEELFCSTDFNLLEEGEREYPLEQEIRLSRLDAKSPAVSRTATASQQIILYSGTAETAFHGRTFRDLGLDAKSLRHIFGDDGADTPKYGLAAEDVEPWWLDLQNPSETELRLLCAGLKIHPLTLEDILNQEKREKIEDYTTYYYVVLSSCRVEGEEPEVEYTASNTYIIVFPTGTLSISYAESAHPNHVLSRIERLQDYVAINSDWIFYAFADDIVDSFFPFIAKIQKRVDEIEDQVYTTRTDDTKEFLLQIENSRQQVSGLIKLLGGKINTLSTFGKHHCEEVCSKAKGGASHELKIYIDDVQDHVVAMVSNLHQFDSLVARSQTNFVAGTSIESVRSSQKLGKLLGQLGVLSMVMTLGNLICGVFSTNVNGDVPMYINNSYSWYYILTAQIVMTVGFMWLARRIGWC